MTLKKLPFGLTIMNDDFLRVARHYQWPAERYAHCFPGMSTEVAQDLLDGKLEISPEGHVRYPAEQQAAEPWFTEPLCPSCHAPELKDAETLNIRVNKIHRDGKWWSHCLPCDRWFHEGERPCATAS